MKTKRILLLCLAVVGAMAVWFGFSRWFDQPVTLKDTIDAFVKTLVVLAFLLVSGHRRRSRLSGRAASGGKLKSFVSYSVIVLAGFALGVLLKVAFDIPIVQGDAIGNFVGLAVGVAVGVVVFDVLVGRQDRKLKAHEEEKI